MAKSPARFRDSLLIVGAVVVGGLCAAVSGLYSPADRPPPSIPEAGPVETASAFAVHGLATIV